MEKAEMLNQRRRLNAENVLKPPSVRPGADQYAVYASRRFAPKPGVLDFF